MVFRRLLASAAAFAASSVGAAEAAAGAGVGVAVAGQRSGATPIDGGTEAVASASAVVEAVGIEAHTSAVGAAAIFVALEVGGVFAEGFVDYFVVFVDAALHLRLAASGEQGEGGGGQERGGDLGRAFHVRVSWAFVVETD